MKKTISLLALFCIMAVLFAGCNIEKSEDEFLECYKQIEIGMPLEDAIDIIGRDPDIPTYESGTWSYDKVWKFENGGNIGLATGYNDLDICIINLVCWWAAEETDWHTEMPGSVTSAYTDFLSLEIGMTFHDVAETLGEDLRPYGMRKTETENVESYTCQFGYLSFMHGLLSWKYFVWANYLDHKVVFRPDNLEEGRGKTYEEMCSFLGAEGVITGVGEGFGFNINTYCWWFSSAENDTQGGISDLHFWDDALGSPLRDSWCNPGWQVELNSD